MNGLFRVGLPVLVLAAAVYVIATSGRSVVEDPPDSVIPAAEVETESGLPLVPVLESGGQQDKRNKMKGPRGQSKSAAKKPFGRTGTPPPGAAMFPDGTWLAPLNGVKFAPPFRGWPRKIPYSPVVGIIDGDKNVQWFEHADGSVSTTQLAPTEQGGRKFVQPAWVIGNPAPLMPVQIPDRMPPKKK